MPTRKLLPLLIVMTLLVLPAVNSLSQSESTKIGKIRQLMEVTGAEKLGEQVLDRLISQAKANDAETPAARFDSVRAQFKTDELIDLIIPVYDKYLTESDIDGIIAFYRSEAGRHLITAMPQIQKESMQIGGDYGRKVTAELQQRLESQKK